MDQIGRFPWMIVKRKRNRFEGLGGLKLKSIIKGNLLSGASGCFEDENLPSHPLHPKKQQQAREAFLHAIAAWPDSLSLELHITSLPDLVHKAQGRVLISLFLRAIAPTEEAVKEEILTRYLSLRPLLASHHPEAEFVPITQSEELEQRFTPFAPTHALAVHRRQDTLSLAAPLKRLTLGFGPVAVKEVKKDNVVKHISPWIPSLDDWARLIDTLVWQLDPIRVIVRLRPAAETDEAVDRLGKTIKTCELFLSDVNEDQITLRTQAGLIRDVMLRQLSDLSDGAFHLGVFILAPHPIDGSLGNVVGRSITVPHGSKDEGGIFRGGFATAKIDVREALKWDCFPEKEPFIFSEAAAAFRLPSPPMEEHPGLPVKRSRTSLVILPSQIPEGDNSIELVINEHQGIIQPVTHGPDDRLRHTFIIGQTGAGKSTLMERMILQDIRAGRGLGVIDPHGDMVDSILGRIPADRAEDVILFDLLDKEKPMGFNLIEWNTPEEKDLIIDELYLTLDRIYDMKQAGGPIFESNFRGMLKLLMNGKTEGHFVPTLLDFTSCYIDERFRDWLKNQTKDPMTLDFVKELERTGGEGSLKNLSPYITSKFSRFTSDTSLMRIVGQEKTGIDFDEIMNEGKVLLIKLGRGRFGPTVSALLANQIVARFKLTAMKRGEIRPEERRDFFLYVDECHNLPRENFMELLAEARKFRMGLVLATQYAAQLAEPGDYHNAFLSAVLGNVGTTLIFRLGLQDAVMLAPILSPQFTSLDITGLPNWNGYARLQTGYESIPAFSFKTRKDETPYDAELAHKIKISSRLKYGVTCRSVDKQIRRRRSLWKEDEDEGE